MPTAVLTDHERTEVQAYLRLLQTVRAEPPSCRPPPSRRRSEFTAAGLQTDHDESDVVLAAAGDSQVVQ